MTRSQFMILLSAVWISPVQPDTPNIIIGLLTMLVGIYFTYKDRE